MTYTEQDKRRHGEEDIGIDPADLRKTASMPLVVDLDGSLLKSDTLHEGLVALINQCPSAALRVVRALFMRGRAAMKAEVSLSSQVDIATLPLREDFLTWLTLQAGAGRKLHLVSAADESIVAKIASRVGIFTSWVGSDGVTNLKGSHKADFLEAEFPAAFPMQATAQQISRCGVARKRSC